MSAAAASSGQDLAQLRDLVAGAVARFNEWAKLMDQPWSTSNAVVIDEAEELRRQFHAAAGRARGLLAQWPTTATTQLTDAWMPPESMAAAAAAAASLEEAACAIRPVSTGLRIDAQLPHIAKASCRATRRFLGSAGRALEDLTDPLPTLHLVAAVGLGHAPSHPRLIGSGTSRA